MMKTTVSLTPLFLYGGQGFVTDTSRTPPAGRALPRETSPEASSPEAFVVQSIKIFKNVFHLRRKWIIIIMYIYIKNHWRFTVKEHYNIEISGIQLNIVSDETEDFVNSIVARIDERVNDMVVRNKRCSKLDAALLCALDYCGEAVKAEKRIRNLEAQISLYDANIKRMREELSQKGAQGVKTVLGVADDNADEAQDADTAEEAPAQDEPAKLAEAEAAPAEERPQSKKSKLEQIEMLLRNSND